MIRGSLHEREGAAPTNFPTTVPDSELVQEMVRDPYLLDFTGLHEAALERDLEEALSQRIERFMLELGRGFTFVGRQFPVRVGNSEYAIDLLFFNYLLGDGRFVVVGLKAREFEPGDGGQVAFYTSWIDENLRRPQHDPTIGITIMALAASEVLRFLSTQFGDRDAELVESVESEA